MRSTIKNAVRCLTSGSKPPCDRKRTQWVSVVIAVLLFGSAPRFASAAQTTLNYMGTHRAVGGKCDGLCCQDFQITVNEPTTAVTIDLGGADPWFDFSCISQACWETQTITGQALFWKQSDVQYSISFSSTSPEVTGPFPVVLNVSLCGSDTCWAGIPWIGWNTSDGNSHHWDTTRLCGDYVHGPCSGCDYAKVYPMGDCANEICFFHNQPNWLTSFKLIFDPPLRKCNTYPGPEAGGGPCNWDSVLKIEQTGWTYSLSPDSSVLTINSNDPNVFGVSQCGSFCLIVPKCSNPQQTVVKFADGYECADSTPFTAAFKDANGRSGLNSGLANFPNPLDPSNGFTTAIPFVTNDRGLALIRVFDATGKQVASESEEVSYVGRHFFYFSAAALPGGTYYYQIEFPSGVVIQKRTMLVVK